MLYTEQLAKPTGYIIQKLSITMETSVQSHMSLVLFLRQHIRRQFVLVKEMFYFTSWNFDKFQNGKLSKLPKFSLIHG